MTYTQPTRFGVLPAIIPLLVEAGTEGFKAYTSYQEGQNIKQQSGSDMATINALLTANRMQAASSTSQDKTPLYLAAGGAALLVLLTALH